MRSIAYSLIAGTFLALTAPLHAATPEFVGVLMLAAEPETAARLQLSDEQREKLLDVIDQRETAALELALELRGLSAAEQAEKLAPFRQESERQGLAILTAEQRTRLEQLRVERRGLASLDEPALAEQVKLTAAQQSELAKLLAERSDAIAAAAPDERERVRQLFERRLAGLLQPAQRTAWEQLAGAAGSQPSGDDLSPDAPPTTDPTAATDATTTPPATEPATPTEATPPTKPTEIAPDSTAPAAQPATGTKPATGAQPAAAPVDPKDVRMVFNFRFQPWKDVLDWFASQADLSLVMDAPPPGTFNYQDSRSYTPAESIDLLNGVLLTKGYTLVRRNRLLMLVNIEDGVPANLVPVVTAAELAERGNFELVTTVFRLRRLTPGEAEEEIKKLVGPQGSVTALPKAGQIVVTDTAGRLRTIAGVLSAVEEPEGLLADRLAVFTLEHASAEEALDIVRQLLDIPSDRNVTSDGSLRVATDSTGVRLLASGKPEAVSRLEEIIKTIDLPGIAATTTVQQALQLEVYPIAAADPETVLQVMQTLLAGQPDVRLTSDAKTGNLIALARPSDHATIQATLAQMQRDGRGVEVIRLTRVDPQLAMLSIRKLFSIDGETAPANAPQIEADTAGGQLLVRGTTAQITQIRELLDKMGENGEAIASEVSGGNIRTIPLTGRAAQSVLDQVELLWPTIRRNKVRIVRPSANINGVRLNDEGPPQRGPARTSIGGSDPFDLFLPEGLPAFPDRGYSPAGPENRPSPIGPGAKPSSVPNDARPEPPPREKGAAPNPDQQDTEAKRDADQNADKAANNDAIQDRSARRLPRVSALLANFQAPVSPDEPASPNQPAAVAPATPQPGEKDNANTAASGNGTAKPNATVEGEPAPVFITAGASGIVIASEDEDALDELESLISTLADQTTGQREYTVFYLKYAKAPLVAELLDEIFSGGTGGDSGGGGGGGSLLGDLAGAALGGGGDLFGGLLGGFGGGGGGGAAAPLATGTVLIVPDARLNALVVQASAADIDTIEQLLRVLDQQGSPEEVQLTARPKIIPVQFTSAEAVAGVVRQVFQDQIAGAAGVSQQRPNPEELLQLLRGGGRGGRGGRGGGGDSRSSQQETPKMTISVDARTNSLVVSAPDSLLLEVELLVRQLDQPTTSSQAIRVVTLKRADPTSIKQALTALTGGAVTSATPSSSGNTPSTGGVTGTPDSNGPSTRSGGSSSDADRRRQDFFNLLRNSGGSRGGFGGGGFGGGRGSSSGRGSSGRGR